MCQNIWGKRRHIVPRFVAMPLERGEYAQASLADWTGIERGGGCLAGVRPASGIGLGGSTDERSATPPLTECTISILFPSIPVERY